jgi:hypothetical protein
MCSDSNETIKRSYGYWVHKEPVSRTCVVSKLTQMKDTEEARTVSFLRH